MIRRESRELQDDDFELESMSLSPLWYQVSIKISLGFVSPLSSPLSLRPIAQSFAFRGISSQTGTKDNGKADLDAVLVRRMFA